MECVQFDPNTKKVSLNRIEVPQVREEDDVIVKVSYAGICGTDVHIIQGEFDCAERPFTLGHEFGGVVTAVGSQVKQFKVGDRVVVDPNRDCGQCTFCKKGQYHLCSRESINNTIGIFRNGGWAQYCKVPVKQCNPIPEDMPLLLAPLCEPLACVLHGWNRIGATSKDARIAILGAGIIGNLWAAVLSQFGYQHVTITEPNPTRRKITQAIGTGYEVTDPSEIKDRKFDLIIDCSGNGKAIEQAFQWLNHGATLCLFGVAPPHVNISISPFWVYRKELKILGVLVNPFTIVQSIDLVNSMKDKLDFKKLGIQMFQLKDFSNALKGLASGDISKAVFQIHPE